jgi:hypothetical protein
MNLNDYIITINQRYKLGNATEHTFRGDLQQLLETMVPEIRATNEPKRQSCGAPDYIITKGEIPVGFIDGKNAEDSPTSSLQFDPTSSVLFTTQNTQCYQCLTPYYSSLIIFCRGGQFQSNEEGSFCPIIPLWYRK